MGAETPFNRLPPVRAATLARTYITEALAADKTLRLILTGEQASCIFGLRSSLVGKLRALIQPIDEGVFMLVAPQKEIAHEAFMGWKNSEIDSDRIEFGKSEYLSLVAVLEAPTDIRRKIIKSTMARLHFMKFEEDNDVGPGMTEYMMRNGSLESEDITNLTALLRILWANLPTAAANEIGQYNPDNVVDHISNG